MKKIPKPKQRLKQAWKEILAASNQPSTGTFKKTPARAAALWHDHVLWGNHIDIAELLGNTIANQNPQAGPVIMSHVGIHMVCPHHMTIAFGQAHVAYVPNGQLLGLGTLMHLIKACTARLILQEDATQAIVDALLEHLQVHAAAALIEAVHPCFALTTPKAHPARISSWAWGGKRKTTAILRELLLRNAQTVA